MATSSNAKFGLPYQGSKSRLAEKIVALLPPASVLVDVFAGGCAIAHAALESGKFERVIANDLSDAPELFYRVAKSGGVKPFWVSREEFFARKDADPIIRYGFSFGNNASSYLYGRGIEQLKHAAHMAVVDGDCSHLPDALRRPVETALAGVVGICDRYPAYKAAIRRLGKRVDLEHLERLERLQRLQHLERLDRLTVSRRDYRDVYIPDNAVIYCDPPYAGTAGYDGAFRVHCGGAFDHRAFYAWCRSVGKRFPLFVSEYWMPQDFRCIAEVTVHVLIGSLTNAQTRTEKIFTI